MQWSDEAIILGSKAHGENHAIVDIFTPSAGRVAALVHGGQGRRKRPLLQAGNHVEMTWAGRNEDSLGHFSLELKTPYAAALMGDRKALSGLTAMTSLICLTLPEKQSVPELYDASLVILSHLAEQDLWPVLLAKWEMGLLSSLGFAICLDRCAATGALLEDGAELTFVSPKSGSAVCYQAGLPYKDKLLPLPPFLIDRGLPDQQDIIAAFELTSFFLQEKLLFPANKQLPEARASMIELLRRGL
ncbi:MAG: DNA repair protein RecO [bacterium]